MRTLLVLASFCTSVAAIVLGSREFNVFRLYFRDDVCKGYTPYRWSTMPSNTPAPEEADKRALCLFYTSMLRVSGHGEGQVWIVAERLRWLVREGTPSAVGPPPPGLGDYS